MRLEEIVKTYGWNYYEMITGRIFQLSQARSLGDGTSEVPVMQDGIIIGFVSVNAEREEL